MSIEEKIKWQNSYSIGVRALDNQNKKLFDLVNKLFSIKDNRSIKEDMREILYGIREYLIVHFKEEEDYMDAISYSELKKHKKMHEEIRDSLSTTINSSDNLNIIKAKLKIVSKRLIIEHIIHEDYKLGLFMKENSIKETVYEIGTISDNNILHRHK